MSTDLFTVHYRHDYDTHLYEKCYHEEKFVLLKNIVIKWKQIFEDGKVENIVVLITKSEIKLSN